MLHALRDQLPVKDAAALGAQLPMLVRGIYYGSWHPGGTPGDAHKPGFLAHIQETFRHDQGMDPALVARAVFQVMSKHMSGGEVESIQRALPEEVRALWQPTTTAWAQVDDS